MGIFPISKAFIFCWIILLTRKSDLEGGDLNFCTYYENEQELLDRLKHFMEQADVHTAGLPFEKFHRLINRGLLGVYLSDRKVSDCKDTSSMAKSIIKASGGTAYFFYVNGKAYRRFQDWRGVM